MVQPSVPQWTISLVTRWPEAPEGQQGSSALVPYDVSLALVKKRTPGAGQAGFV